MPLHRLSGSFKVCFLCVVKSMCQLHMHCSLHCQYISSHASRTTIWCMGRWRLNCCSISISSQLYTQLCIINAVHVYVLFSNKLEFLTMEWLYAFCILEMQMSQALTKLLQYFYFQLVIYTAVYNQCCACVCAVQQQVGVSYYGMAICFLHS